MPSPIREARSTPPAAIFKTVEPPADDQAFAEALKGARRRSASKPEEATKPEKPEKPAETQAKAKSRKQKSDEPAPEQAVAAAPPVDAPEDQEQSAPLAQDSVELSAELPPLPQGPVDLPQQSPDEPLAEQAQAPNPAPFCPVLSAAPSADPVPQDVAPATRANTVEAVTQPVQQATVSPEPSTTPVNQPSAKTAETQHKARKPIVQPLQSAERPEQPQGKVSAEEPKLAIPQAAVEPAAPDKPDASSAEPKVVLPEQAAPRAEVATALHTPQRSESHATPPAPSPAAPAQIAHNRDNIISAVRTQLLPKGGSMQIRLDPPELGVLQITVQLRDGVMTASFQTSTDDATRMLSHSLNQLKHALEATGLTIDKIQVQQMDRTAEPRQQPQERQPSDQGSPQQEQQRRQNLRQMWRRLSRRDEVDVTA